MTFIEGAAESIFDHYGPEAKIHSVKHGRQHAHVRLGSGNDQGVDSFIVEKRRKTGFRKRGIGWLIYNRCRGYQAGEGTISS